MTQRSKPAPRTPRPAAPAAARPAARRTPARRTQEMRSAATRAKLIEATLRILAERGYARATTADIADLAGVSRGALNHHFESKDDLVAQAVDDLLRRAIVDIAALAEQVQARRLDLDAFLDRLWAMFSGRLFLVTLEHVTEARHNAWLRTRLVPMVRSFHDALDRIWQAFFADTGLPPADLRDAFNATLCLLRGMGLQTVLRRDDAYYAALLAFWKAELAARLSHGRSAP